jgi:hypothetical protein
MINVLSAALNALPKQKFKLKRFIRWREDDAGLKICDYMEPVDVVGNVQPVKLDMYQKLGLDFKKTYLKIWVLLEAINVLDGENSPDILTINGVDYTPIQKLDWLNYDSWSCILAVKN